MLSLTGPAGTGKTVMTTEIIKELLKRFPTKRVRLSTPTHKSLNVAKKMLPKTLLKHKKLSLSTVHKFLKLKAEKVEDKIKFVEDLLNRENERANILIVDESSMISEDLFKLIKTKLKRGDIEIVIFVGDKVQLPPVDGDTNPVYHKIKQYELTEIVRQALDNPLLKRANEIRKSIESKTYDMSLLQFDEKDSKDGLKVYHNHEAWLGEYYYDKGDKVISAFTNNTVIAYNHALRNAWLRNDNPPQIVNDDVLILQEAYMPTDPLHDEDDAIMNGSVIEVRSCTLQSYDLVKLNYWRVEGWSVEDEDDVKFNVLDTESYDRWQKLLNKIAEKAKKAKSLKQNPKEFWDKFWKLKSMFADVKYNYAMTIHKLQGSTYENVYLNMKDTVGAMSHDKDQLFRLVYVALTRASKEVHIYS